MMTTERKQQLRRQYLSADMCQQLNWRDMLAGAVESPRRMARPELRRITTYGAMTDRPRTTYMPKAPTTRTPTPTSTSTVTVTPSTPTVSPAPQFANEWERKAIAHHEAGHAMAYMLFGAKDIQADIVPAPGRLGSARGEGIEDKETQAVIILAGMYSESRFRTPTGRPVEVGFLDPLPGQSQDQAKLFALIGRPDGQNMNLHGRLRAAAQLLVARHWSEIQTLAAALLTRGSVGDADLRRMFPYTRPYRKWW